MFFGSAHGWNIDIGQIIGCKLVQLLWGFGRVASGGMVLCTLLGPEGPGLTLWCGIGPLDHDLLLGRGFRTRVWCFLWEAVERVPPVF